MKSKEPDVQFFKKLSKKLRSPEGVQLFLREQFPYNFETKGETLYSAREALRRGRAHCLEASLVAAAILEQMGYPPLVMSLESLDDLDHVVIVFKGRTGWGAVGRSREPGLHGREPVFKSIRNLALSYWDPFVDKTGALTGFGTVSLNESGADWRYSEKNVWKVERFLIDLPHQDFKWSAASRARKKHLHQQYLARGPIQSGKHWW